MEPTLMSSKLTLITCSMLLLTGSLVFGQQQPLVEKYLLSGNFSQGEKDLEAHLEKTRKTIRRMITNSSFSAPCLQPNAYADQP